MPPSPGRLTFGRCSRCLRPATMRGTDGSLWGHDPGRSCGEPDAEFLAIEPFDPIRPYWRVEDARALYLDLPTMPRRTAESAARLLLRRYTAAFDEAGVHFVGDVLLAAERARLTDEPDLPSFDGPAVSSDYAPEDNDESDVGDQEDEWRPTLRQEASGARRPRRALLPPPENPPTEEPPEEEWDDSPAPTIP